MTLHVILIGAGGHSRVLIDCLRLVSIEIIGIVDADVARVGLHVDEIPILGTDDVLEQYPPSSVQLVNAIGSVSSPAGRRRVFQSMHDAGYTFPPVLHPSAVIAGNSQLAEGVQVMAGSIIQPGTVVGANTIVNTKASVDHDCRIGAHVHIAPGATLSGGVTLGDAVHVGTGATIIQGITVGSGAIIGAGAVVIRDVRNGETVLGVPAKVVR